MSKKKITNMKLNTGFMTKSRVLHRQTNSEERKIKQTRNNYACLKTKVINVFQNLSND